MNDRLEVYADYHICLHADCILVEGAKQSAVYDLTREEIILFPTDYVSLLRHITSRKAGTLIKEFNDPEDRAVLDGFLDFLEEHEVIIFLKNPARFPALKEHWEIPAVIQNAIVDVDQLFHDFDKIFTELDELGCLYVQVRSFGSLLSLADLYRIAALAWDKSMYSIEFIVRYDSDITDEAYARFVEEAGIVSVLTLHSAPADRAVKVAFGSNGRTGMIKEVRFVTACIDSSAHCGIITTSHLLAPSVSLFMEHKLYNGCLNRKIAVDKEGTIRNCPSMPLSYGNIMDNHLSGAVFTDSFRAQWNMTKDRITVCRDCEFRYSCTDCRAYLEDPDDPYSKPLKCGYNPYTAEWEDWSTHPDKQRGILFYGMGQSSKP
jgi:SPASM domain peptide maturase of grasp-with-spasm system